MERLLEQGRTEEEVYQQFPVLRPEAKPQLFPDLVWIWEGYTMLSSSRQWGMSAPQPISLREMLSYLDFQGIDDLDERSEFIHLCLFLDRRFMADALARSKPGEKGKPPRKPSGIPPR